VGRYLILRASILIAYERATIDPAGLDADALAVAAATIAECRVGIEVEPTLPPGRLTARGHWSPSPRRSRVLDYTEITAAAHARLIALARRSGMLRTRCRDQNNPDLRCEGTLRRPARSQRNRAVRSWPHGPAWVVTKARPVAEHRESADDLGPGTADQT
jgi:tRNA(fMet)-specific endonuclease VapC